MELFTSQDTKAQALTKLNDNVDDTVSRSSLGYFDVMEYGALGDGSTDDSAAINLALAAAYDNGGGTVFFPPGHYICSGALGSANSVLWIKSAVQTVYNFEPVSIRLVGAGRSGMNAAMTAPLGGGVCLDFTGCPAGSGSVPALIACTSYTSTTFNSTGCGFCDVQPFIDGITILAPSNPTLAGLNFGNCTKAMIGDDVAIFAQWSASGTKVFANWGTSGIVFPTDTDGIGVIMPQALNNKKAVIGAAIIIGWNVGLVASEHTAMRDTQISYCDTGLNLMGGGVGVTSGHRITGSVSIENCVKPIISGNGDTYIDLTVQFELGSGSVSPGAWWLTTYHVTIFSSSLVYGQIRYESGTAGGIVFNTLALSQACPGLVQFNLADGALTMTLPTSDPAVTGQLWNNSATIKRSA